MSWNSAFSCQQGTESIQQHAQCVGTSSCRVPTNSVRFGSVLSAGRRSGVSNMVNFGTKQSRHANMTKAIRKSFVSLK
eukprot:6191350-Pleurochrysis_carterae.AAC.3